MDKIIRQISREIQNSKQLEQNIPQLFNYMADDYQVFAGVRLAMHYFTFYEAFCDDEYSWSKDTEAVISKVNHIIHDNILFNQSGKERENAILELDSIRKDIMKRMNSMTTYADIFQNYEYVLNRLEYRFKEMGDAVDEEEFSKEILRYIFDSEDNFVINEKIKEIIGQLPIRITKQKYFELLMESLGVYLGAEGASFDTYLYMIRTSAMLYREEGMEELYPMLWEKKEYLSKLDYKDMTKDNYEKALSILQAATFMLETETTVFFGLQEIVNEVYALLLCSPYSGMVDNANADAGKAAITIIKDINNIFIQQEKRELSTEIMDQFTELEGVQEELSFEIEVMENALYELNQNQATLIQSLMLDQFKQVLLSTQSLLSNSLFIDFEEQVDAPVVDEVRLKKESENLEQDLKDLFTSHDRMIGRAVMANTLNKVPVFFKDHKDVMDYVCYSLERCSDEYEKAACIEIINEIMSE